MAKSYEYLLKDEGTGKFSLKEKYYLTMGSIVNDNVQHYFVKDTLGTEVFIDTILKGSDGKEGRCGYIGDAPPQFHKNWCAWHLYQRMVPLFMRALYQVPKFRSKRIEIVVLWEGGKFSKGLFEAIYSQARGLDTYGLDSELGNRLRNALDSSQYQGLKLKVHRKAVKLTT